MAKLKRTLGLGECVFFGVGSILGAGIYTLIGKVAGHSGNLIWVAFIIASITAVLTAFSYAELSSLFPKAGGEYVYAKKAFGSKIGIALGLIISMNGIVSGATVSLGFAGYVTELISINTLVAAIGIIVLIFIVNAAGIRQSSWVNIVFTLIGAGGLFFIVYCSLPSIGEVDLTKMHSSGINGLLIAAALAFFGYMGFEDVVKLAEETNEPKKNIPKALFIASFIVVVVYLAVAVSAVNAIPYEELQKTESPLTDIAKQRFGNTGFLIITIIALFPISNTILTNMLGSSRVLLNMSQKTKFLKPLSYVSDKRKTPIASLIFILVVMIGFAIIQDLEMVAQITTSFIFLTFIIVNLSVIILRFKEKDTERPFRVPLNVNNIPIISILGILMTLLLLAYNLYSLFQK